MSTFICRDNRLLSTQDTATLPIAQGAELHPYELADALAQLQDTFQYTQKQLAEFTSKPESEISRLLSLLKLNPAVEREARQDDTGTITKRHLAALSQLPALAHAGAGRIHRTHRGGRVPLRPNACRFFYREGSLRLQIDAEFLYPDCAFCIQTPDGRSVAFFAELDNGTESVATRAGNGAFERKIRFYEAYKDQCKARGLDHRFRVILVTAKTNLRLGHLLQRTAELLRLQQRPLVYGITLADYCASDVSLTVPCFEDNCGQRRVLVPPAPVPNPTVQVGDLSLAPAAAL